MAAAVVPGALVVSAGHRPLKLSGPMHRPEAGPLATAEDASPGRRRRRLLVMLSWAAARPAGCPAASMARGQDARGPVSGSGRGGSRPFAGCSMPLVAPLYGTCLTRSSNRETYRHLEI